MNGLLGADAFGSDDDVMRDDDRTMVIGEERMGMTRGGGPPAPETLNLGFSKKPCMLPEDEEELLREMREYEAEGVGENGYECECCRKGNDGLTKETSEQLRRVSTLDETFFLTVPDEEIYRMTAHEYNRIVDKQVLLRRDKVGMQRLTPAKVKYHMTKHDRRNKSRLIWNTIDRTRKIMDFLYNNAIFQRHYLGDEPQDRIEVDSKALENFMKAGKLHAELVKFTETLPKVRSGGGKGTSSISSSSSLTISSSAASPFEKTHGGSSSNSAASPVFGGGGGGRPGFSNF
jgi:hypothetical protein